MPRLFIGTFLSDDGVEKLSALADGNRHLTEAWNTKVRWVDRTKLHITWVFLGEIENEAIPDLSVALGKAVSEIILVRKPLVINYNRFELWPSERKASLGVITPDTVPDDAGVIADTIKRAMKQYIPREQRQHERKQFQPHITIMRFPRHDRKSHSKQRTPAPASVASGRPSLKDVVAVPGVFPIEHTIDQIALIESDLGKKTQGYEALSVFKIH